MFLRSSYRCIHGTPARVGQLWCPVAPTCARSTINLSKLRCTQSQSQEQTAASNDADTASDAGTGTAFDTLARCRCDRETQSIAQKLAFAAPRTAAPRGCRSLAPRYRLVICHRLAPRLALMTGRHILAKFPDLFGFVMPALGLRTG